MFTVKPLNQMTRISCQRWHIVDFIDLKVYVNVTTFLALGAASVSMIGGGAVRAHVLK